ncbi:hypothetical protein CDD82_4957 [Ophiocordyceps australis]|uniref:tRNA-binding domain-containing protein n=1 Tax=Ophiocordyceps australis TaxID=1399860 RepID=A0A2C5Z3E1_9HYPO|nr:hypothetical protein CDD82_4957 [Ophiocordyceps australis]
MATAKLLSTTSYTAAEEAEIESWVTAASRLRASSSDPAARTLLLDSLNSHLASRTTVLGSKPSRADTALFHALAPLVAQWSPEDRSGQHGRPHIVRLVDFVQHADLFELAVAQQDLVAVDLDDVRYVKPPLDAKAEKERLKKEKAAAAATAQASSDAQLVDRSKPKAQEAAGQTKGAAREKPGKENKPKAPKPQKSAPAATPLSPCLIDLRVGHILKAINHPDADSLFVSTIAMGDPPSDDTVEYQGQVCRTVCSGLNGLIPLEHMQGRKVVVVCNLKPVKMRGIKSSAMVLAASPRLKPGESDDHKGPVELVSPPPDSKPGDRVFFNGWKGEPEGQLNPKKKIWETFQPGFTTTDDLAVAFDAAAVEQLATKDVGKLVTEAGGLCTVQTLKGAVVR